VYAPSLSLLLAPPPSSTLFPYTTLFRSTGVRGDRRVRGLLPDPHPHRTRRRGPAPGDPGAVREAPRPGRPPRGGSAAGAPAGRRSEEHTSELQSRENLVCRLLLEKKKKR